MRSPLTIASCLALMCSLAQASKPCDCADLKDLLNRISVAQIAIDTLHAERPAAVNAGAPTAPAPGGAQSNKDALKATLSKNIREGRDPAAKVASAETFVDCKMTVNAPTACLKVVLEAHELLHQARCEVDKRRLKLDTTEDRWPRKSLLEYVDEEIASYAAEKAEAVTQVRGLPPTCRPTGWVGTITAFQVKALTTSITTPPANKYSHGSTETMIDKLSRWGTIRYSPTPTASWRVQRVANMKKVSGKLVGCQGGLKTMPANQHEVNTTFSEVNGEGSLQNIPVVSVALTPDRLYYTLSLSLPDMVAEVSMGGYNKSEGGCNPYDTPLPTRAASSPIGAISGITVNGRMKPTDTVLSGSEDVNLQPHLATVPGIPQSSDVVRVQWNLRRVD